MAGTDVGIKEILRRVFQGVPRRLQTHIRCFLEFQFTVQGESLPLPRIQIRTPLYLSVLKLPILLGIPAYPSVGSRKRPLVRFQPHLKYSP